MERNEKLATDRPVAGEAMRRDAGVARERNWSQMGLEEKVERLHRLCTTLVQVSNRMADRLEEAHATAHQHFHDPLGRIGVPPREGFANYPLNALRISDHDIR